MDPIESACLIMTTWRRDDLDAAQRLWGDSRVMRYLDSRGALSREQVAERLQQEIDRQEQFGVQYWKVILKETSAAIGCCGLRPYDVENRVYELGFHFMSEHWGRGFASEAARAVIRHAFESMKVPKLFAAHHPQNAASAAVLKKLGFRRIGDEFYAPTCNYHPCYELNPTDLA